MRWVFFKTVCLVLSWFIMYDEYKRSERLHKKLEELQIKWSNSSVESR